MYVEIFYPFLKLVVSLRLSFESSLLRTGVSVGSVICTFPPCLGGSFPSASSPFHSIHQQFLVWIVGLCSVLRSQRFSLMFSSKSVRFRSGIWVHDPFLFSFCVGWERRSRLGEFKFFTKFEKFGPRFLQVLFLAPISLRLLGPRGQNAILSGVAPRVLETPFHFPVFVPSESR